jgi:hypothetical protein
MRIHAEDGGTTFSVIYAPQQEPGPLDGRLLLILSTSDEKEPRFQITGDVHSQQIFGIDVEDWLPHTKSVFNASVFGYPRRSMAELAKRRYWVQAVLHRYETFQRADGHVVKLPMDRGEGQQWNLAPGNLLSTPRQVDFDPHKEQVIQVELDHKILPLPEPPTTKYVKHVRIKSKLLSEFWGRPMHLGAHVLLPEGFDEHPHARYPLVIFHGHFPATFSGFREEPPDPNLKPEFSKRFQMEGYNRIVEEYAWRFYQDWTGPDFPRVLLVEIQHANPYYDDSYAVNSRNLGPYGDAITYELVPHLEQTFRGIGAGWARFLYGGSTGGWEALAAQIFYPNEYNGCYAACPDPIDFRAFTVVNIYEDKNAYYVDGPFGRVARPGMRNYLGHLSATLEGMNHLELVLGSRGRSGQQWDVWQAVYSPVGSNGYPQPIWDKLSGEIDHEVAAYWREHYDLSYILARDWNELGPKLQGKIHIYVGDMDNYYLNNAVYLTEEVLRKTQDPPFDGVIEYGDRHEHCWNGDHQRPNAISRLRYHQMYLPLIVERILKTAPPDGDTTSWRY